MSNALYSLLVVGAGCAANLLFGAMFIARVLFPGRARTLGFAGTAMAAPLALASGLAWLDAADVWLVVLPLVFVGFAAIEVVVDVISDTDVRTTRWLWPYLMAFYLAQWAIVGAAFLVSAAGGAAVLVTYFICLTATAWSYRRVGHGNRSDADVAARADGPTTTRIHTPHDPDERTDNGLGNRSARGRGRGRAGLARTRQDLSSAAGVAGYAQRLWRAGRQRVRR